jgi:hypothetical protein
MRVRACGGEMETVDTVGEAILVILIAALVLAAIAGALWLHFGR